MSSSRPAAPTAAHRQWPRPVALVRPAAANVSGAPAGAAPAPARASLAEVGPSEVADLIKFVAVADQALDAVPVRLREGVGVRSQLAGLAPDLLRAGGALWARRRAAARTVGQDLSDRALGPCMSRGVRP